MDAVENTLVDALVALENDHNRVQGLTGFNWIVNDIMNATYYQYLIEQSPWPNHLKISHEIEGVLVISAIWRAPESPPRCRELRAIRDVSSTMFKFPGNIRAGFR